MEKLVFLHGWINKYIVEKDKNIEEFYKELIEELKKKFEVYFVVLPGFSQNPEPSKPLSLDDYVNYVKDYVEKNNLESFYLMGHSFGGQIACKFAYLYPEKVRFLILYNPACIRKQSLKFKLFSKFKNIGKILFKICPFSQKVFYKIFSGSTYYLKFSDIMKRTMQNIIQEDLTEILPHIKVKTLIIWGGKDRITPLKYGKLINNLIPNSKLVIYKNGNHSFHKENPHFIVEQLMYNY